MTESFLHYLWQFQYFDKKALATTTGESLTILAPGTLNTNAGPDFYQAKIKLNDIAWAGCAEIHIQASGWYEHHHDNDDAYENVVLHVVWEENKPVFRKDGTRLPTLALKERVEPGLLSAYQKLVNNTAVIPCQSSFAAVAAVTKYAMVDRAAMARLEAKAKEVNNMLVGNQGDWEETFWQLLAANFGFKVNKDPFAQLAKALPYKTIRKHSHNILQTEALLFGQAGFLVARSKDEYLTQLFNEYEFLKNKYGLDQGQLNVAQWKFLRLRPANFPTLRLAQLSALLGSHSSIFSAILEAEDYSTLTSLFRFDTSPYWKSHYRFGKKSLRVPGFGKLSQDVMVINTLVPVLVAYGQLHDDWRYVDRAVQILQQLPIEKNRITRIWNSLGYAGKNAFESQGLIELYQHFCQRSACLNCAVGSAILKPGLV